MSCEMHGQLGYYIPENFEANNLPLEFSEMHRMEIQDGLLACHFDGYP